MGRRREESTEPEIEFLEKEFEEKAPGVGYTEEQFDLFESTIFKAFKLREKPAKAYWDNKDKARVRERIRQEQKAGKKKPQPSKEDAPAKPSSKQYHDTVSSVKKTPRVVRSKSTTTTTEKKKVTFAPTTPTNLKSRNLLSAMNSVSEEKPSKVCQDKSHSEEGQYSPGSIKALLQLSEKERDSLVLFKAMEINVVKGRFSPNTQAFLQLSENGQDGVLERNAYDNSDLMAFGAKLARSNHKADGDFHMAQSTANQDLLKAKSDANEKLYLAHSATKEKNDAIFDGTVGASRRKLDVYHAFLKKTWKECTTNI